MRRSYLAIALALTLGFSVMAIARPASAQISVGISVRVGPPALPVYAQPVCPGPDYIWTPGFWAWGQDGYYWVPGTWVLAPQPGLLWTPGYWGYEGGAYIWHGGYWGPHVGFYGGINYGFGYFGTGFVGGEWRGGHFAYNRAVTNVNVRIVRNVYVNRTVVRNEHVNRVSYNGGPHGINARPTEEQQRWSREQHSPRTEAQDQHEARARNDRSLHYSQNHGRPPVGATQRPNEFSRPAAHPNPTPHNQPRPNNRQPERATPRTQRPQPQPREQRGNERGNQQRPQEQQRNERGNQHPQERQQRNEQHGNEQHGRDGGHDGGR